MENNEKIKIVGKLLKSLMNLPNKSGLSEKDAFDIYQTILGNQEKIDEYIVTLTSTLEKIGNKIKETNYEIDKMIIQDNENYEKEQEQKNINSLFNNF